jgi:hypothetical protein
MFLMQSLEELLAWHFLRKLPEMPRLNLLLPRLILLPALEYWQL